MSFHLSCKSGWNKFMHQHLYKSKERDSDNSKLFKIVFHNQRLGAEFWCPETNDLYKLILVLFFSKRLMITTALLSFLNHYELHFKRENTTLIHFLLMTTEINYCLRLLCLPQWLTKYLEVLPRDPYAY